jgi:hypothetical protein
MKDKGTKERVNRLLEKITNHPSIDWNQQHSFWIRNAGGRLRHGDFARLGNSTQHGKSLGHLLTTARVERDTVSSTYGSRWHLVIFEIMVLIYWGVRWVFLGWGVGSAVMFGERSGEWGVGAKCLVVRYWCRSFIYNRPIENPKRRLLWAQQQVFSQLWNQGLSNQ